MFAFLSQDKERRISQFEIGLGIAAALASLVVAVPFYSRASGFLQASAASHVRLMGRFHIPLTHPNAFQLSTNNYFECPRNYLFMFIDRDNVRGTSIRVSDLEANNYQRPTFLIDWSFCATGTPEWPRIDSFAAAISRLTTLTIRPYSYSII
jgi:hypothetical protein